MPLMAGGSSASLEAQKIMEFGEYNCEDEMARLDHLANELHDNPATYAYIIVYGGRRGMRRDEVRVRAARMRRYLVENRGVSRERVEVVNGGFRQKLSVEFWLVPRGEKPPAATPTVKPTEVRFKKGNFEVWAEPGCFPDELPVAKASAA